MSFQRTTRHSPERPRRAERAQSRETRAERYPRGDEPNRVRERSRSRERGDRYHQRSSRERYPRSTRHDGNLGPGRAQFSAGPSNPRGPPPRHRGAAPPPPPPRRQPNVGDMSRIPASHGRATSAGGLRPSEAPFNPRQLTSHLGNTRDQRTHFRGSPRRDERTHFRGRNVSRERERGGSSADRGAVDRRPHGYIHRAPPLPPPRQPDVGGMPRMAASQGWAISAGGLRPNAAALNSRQLTAELGRARALPQLLSLYERHGDRFDHFNLGAFWSKFQKMPHG